MKYVTEDHFSVQSRQLNLFSLWLIHGIYDFPPWENNMPLYSCAAYIFSKHLTAL